MVAEIAGWGVKDMLGLINAAFGIAILYTLVKLPIQRGMGGLGGSGGGGLGGNGSYGGGYGGGSGHRSMWGRMKDRYNRRVENKELRSEENIIVGMSKIINRMELAYQEIYQICSAERIPVNVAFQYVRFKGRFTAVPAGLTPEQLQYLKRYDGKLMTLHRQITDGWDDYIINLTRISKLSLDVRRRLMSQLGSVN